MAERALGLSHRPEWHKKIAFNLRHQRKAKRVQRLKLALRFAKIL